MKFSLYKIIKIFIAIVWLINGIYAKILGFVPRHELIVAEILQTQHSKIFIIIIGIAEILMAIWILSGVYARINAVTQAIVILSMNILEFTFAQDLLLWGKLNFIFACLFVILILWNEFHLKPNVKP